MLEKLMVPEVGVETEAKSRGITALRLRPREKCPQLCGARQNESGSAQQIEAIRVTELGATFVTLSLRISGAGTVAGALGVPAELGSW